MKGGVGGPCCHCGATSSPCWRKGPQEKPILCNACGARYLVKRSLDGYMPGQKPSKFATTSPACEVVQQQQQQQQKPGPKRGVGDGPSRKRRVVDRYDIQDLYHFTTTKRARGRATQPAPVSINVTAGLGGLMQTSISLWKPAETCAAFTTAVRGDVGPSLKSFFSYPAGKAHLQMDSDAVVLASALALLRQTTGSSDSSSGSSSCHSSSSTSRSPSPAADDFPRRRRKQQHPIAGAAS